MVKFPCLSRTICILLAAGLLLIHFTATGQTKQIRLRNETITTTPAAKTVAAAQLQAQGLSTKTPASGLFLVQFENPLSPADRAELQTLGVELLKYVPDDAFVARFNNVSPDKVGGLSYVRWVGPFRPDDKIHPGLSAAVRGTLPTNQLVAVNILLSPDVTPAGIAGVRSLLASVQHESRLRQGTILRGTLDPARLSELAQSSSILWIERAPRRKLVDEFAAKVVGGDDGNAGTRTVTQQRGFGGAGVTVCVADTGLDTGNTNTLHPDLRGRVTGFKYYGSLTDGSDGYGHGTHCAGIVAGNAATGETDPDTGAYYGLGVEIGRAHV